MAEIRRSDYSEGDLKWTEDYRSIVGRGTLSTVWAVQIVDALCFIHGKELSHQNLKLKNVLVSMCFSLASYNSVVLKPLTLM